MTFGLILSLFSFNGQAAVTGTEKLINSQQRPWQPVTTALQLPLWPEDLSIARAASAGAEVFGTSTGLVAGRPVTMVEHVSRPTMTVYRAINRNTGAAVIVFPGGGYRTLAIDLEGTEVCDWLTTKGVTCVVLKYRVPGSGPYWSDECDCRRVPAVPMALQDAQRAMGILRQRAQKLGVDPHKIGVLGFSARGHVVAEISNHVDRNYVPVDAADAESSRPNFALALYPGHLWEKPGLTLNPTIKIDPNGPPTFIVQAGDDPTDDVRHSLAYYFALQQAKVPVELHLYAEGGHAFGLRRTSKPITSWPTLAEKWMRSIGVLPASD